jgi:hypothetical protein
MKWLTRANVKVDRVACPWLIRTFVDPEAEFVFVPVDQVDSAVRKTEPSRMTLPARSSVTTATNAHSMQS